MAEVYVSTDIESDGPIPGPHSMLSFASAAYSTDKTLLSTFSANLQALPGASGHPKTMEWWKTQPEAWAACSKDPQPPEEVMTRYLEWLKSLPGKPVLTGYPVSFDFLFVYWYLIRFTGESPFSHSALDIKTYAMAMLKAEYSQSSKRHMPRNWFDDLPHTHIALDDAIGQGALFCNMLAENLGREKRPKESVKVFLHNDDRTTMEFVVFILQSIFDKSEEEATKITMQVHNDGQGLAGSYSLDIARSKVSAVQRLARARCFPLNCSIENQEDNVMTQKSAQHRLPPGWIMAGSDPDDYEVGIDATVAHSGSKCAYVTHGVESPQGFGTLMQQFAPDEYLQKRLCLKMWVKTADVAGRVQPWMRIDGPKPGKLLGFDNTCQRHIKGTTDWQECKIVLDVPAEATKIAFGIMLAGRGKLWMDDVSFEEVGTDVPATDCICHTGKKARNLSFEE